MSRVAAEQVVRIWLVRQGMEQTNDSFVLPIYVKLADLIDRALHAAKKSVTKDDICEITGKHVESASPSDRYCPCNTCQHYLQRIIAGIMRDSDA